MKVGKDRNVGENTIFDGVVNIGFVTIFVIMTIDCHPRNDGLSTIVLTLGVIGGFLLLVFLQFLLL
jgi:hypothetical protein